MWKKIKRRWTEIRSKWRDYPLQQGTLWMERYRIEQFIGMGSYGQAYACVDMTTGKAVLLKRNKPSKGNIGRELLQRESMILKQLNHPQIPKWLDYWKNGRDEALIMQLVNGNNLEFLIMEQGRTFQVKEALLLLKELLQPLKELHHAGFVHRDVRIPNVMEGDGTLYLIDFGLACRIGEQLPDQLREGLGEDAATIKESGDESGAAVKQRMRKPCPSSDLYGLGHLFLFLMYAGYPIVDGQAERSWEEELELGSGVKSFVQWLFYDDNECEGWRTAIQCEQHLDRLLAELNNEASCSTGCK